MHSEAISVVIRIPRFRDKGDTLADRATLTTSLVGVFGLGLRTPGQEDFFFAYAQKTKHFTGPLQNGSVNLGNGNTCYVSMNHFETATATKQQKGIAQKRNPPAQQKRDQNTLYRRCGMGGRRSSPERSYSRLGAQGGYVNGWEQNPAGYLESK